MIERSGKTVVKSFDTSFETMGVDQRIMEFMEQWKEKNEHTYLEIETAYPYLEDRMLGSGNAGTYHKILIVFGIWETRYRADGLEGG